MVPWAPYWMEFRQIAWSIAKGQVVHRFFKTCPQAVEAKKAKKKSFQTKFSWIFFCTAIIYDTIGYGNNHIVPSKWGHQAFVHQHQDHLLPSKNPYIRPFFRLLVQPFQFTSERLSYKVIVRAMLPSSVITRSDSTCWTRPHNRNGWSWEQFLLEAPSWLHWSAGTTCPLKNLGVEILRP